MSLKKNSNTKQQGAGFFGDLFGIKSNKRGYNSIRGNSSYDSETGYHLTPEQKKMREQERTRDIRYSRTVESEQDLIDSYENLAKSSRQYYKNYNRHLGNLIVLDESLGIRGLEQTFKNQVIKNVFKGNDVVDRSNPLLLRNFLVSNATLPRNFRKEHLLSQVRYILRKFNPKDEILIQSIDIAIEGKKAIIKLRGLNGDPYERTVGIDDDFNLDINDLKRNLKEILVSIKRKMDFEIEIVSDFELGSEDLEIPMLNFIDEDTALDRRLKDLELRKTLHADGPVPISQMSAKGSKKKSVPPVIKKNIIFDVSEPKPKYEYINLDTAQQPAVVEPPGTQGFGEQRPIGKTPFDYEDAIFKIMEGGPGAQLGQPTGAQQGQPGIQPGQATAIPQQINQPQQINLPQRLQPPQPAGALNNKDPLEKKCNDLTSQPDVCSKTLGCYYDRKLNPPKCHRDVKI